MNPPIGRRRHITVNPPTPVGKVDLDGNRTQLGQTESLWSAGTADPPNISTTTKGARTEEEGKEKGKEDFVQRKQKEHMS